MVDVDDMGADDNTEDYWDRVDALQEEHEATFDPNNPNHTKLVDLLGAYGPAKLIDRARANELCQAGEAGRVFCLHRTDSDVMYGSVGFHMVDVDERFELSKPAPLDLEVYGCAEINADEIEGFRRTNP
jgi:hypothetical protein